ncbi:MAG TPA: TIGR04086 family membrane protein [Chloroflexia bacterium]
MKAQLSQVRWDLVLKTSILIYILTFILGVGLSLLLPPVFNWGHIDPERAVQAVVLIGPVLVIVVTGYGAWWVARKVEHAALLQGLLVGVVVALISFLLDVAFSMRIDPVGLLFYALMIAAGWLGGSLGSRR